MTAEPMRELVSQWRAEAQSLRRRGAEVPATALSSCAEDLERCLQELQEAPLTLPEAAELSGYSSDHLGRLVREGKIPNAGRRGAPRILRQDVPLKAGAVASRHLNRDLDRTQIVRFAINSGD